ncbi:hypothetical protein [Desulfovibrio sp. UCD-KL4C]|uniref:hypothetical protein n=1 Tax=Desulfovibrio sp. UCD-KL4C TaxID=2578120 RepID=UPI0025BF349C|nr:hypothetical protein [Desulfovibrio sp. UCD-KL4C]
MGINISFLPLIAKALSHANSGEMLMYGVQDIEFTIKEAMNYFDLENTTCNSSSYDAHGFFKELGFSKVSALDISNFEGAEYIFDLNETVPDYMHDKFDFIYDGGTLEHIFNIPAALSNGVAMLKKGGIIFHHSPMNNWVNHGFYQFSPTLFFDYYMANGFANCSLFLFKEDGGVKRFGPRDMIPSEYYEINTLLAFVAQKISNNNPVIPQQSAYTYSTNMLAGEIKNSPLYIWGTSERFTKLYMDWFNANKEDLNFLGFIDSSLDKQAMDYCGYKVHPPSILEESPSNTVVIVAASFLEVRDLIPDLYMNLRFIR